MQSYTRYIDKVTLKGSIRPIGLFTIDLYVDELPESKYPDNLLTKFDKVFFNFLLTKIYFIKKKKKNEESLFKK